MQGCTPKYPQNLQADDTHIKPDINLQLTPMDNEHLVLNHLWISTLRNSRAGEKGRRRGNGKFPSLIRPTSDV